MSKRSFVVCWASILLGAANMASPIANAMAAGVKPVPLMVFINSSLYCTATLVPNQNLPHRPDVADPLDDGLHCLDLPGAIYLFPRGGTPIRVAHSGRAKSPAAPDSRRARCGRISPAGAGDGWRFGAQLTASHMQTHFANCRGCSAVGV